VVVPVRRLQNGVFPKVIAEHLLDQANHAPERIRHTVILKIFVLIIYFQFISLRNIFGLLFAM
jgi:hypothetical protein